MTQQRRAPAGGSISAAPGRGGDQPAPTGPSAPKPAALPPWDEFFQSIPPLQQNQLLARAREQGLLYSHQLPYHGNGSPSDPGRLFLTRLLNGQTDDLQAVRGQPLNVVDHDLDAAQRDAVSRALDTP